MQLGKRHGDLQLSEYGIVGDGKTAALVAVDGSVDWMCHRRFDGPAVFCRLLDSERGGLFQVSPDTQFESTQAYVGQTNVLATEFVCAGGTIRTTDFMPLASGPGSLLLRKVEGLGGEVDVRVEFVPTFDFARADTTVDLVGDGAVARSSGRELRLSCPAPMQRAPGGATSSFRVRAGDTRWVVLTEGETPLGPDAARDALASTLAFWERWVAHGTFPGPYAEALRRSALVLKLLIHAPTGGMVAAPTTSLPEEAGGVRNWDYRFTWLRDSSWVVGALMDLGYHDETMAFIDWIESLDLARRSTAVLFDLDRNVPCDEECVTHLRGYRSSQPIRIGNAAAAQDQHDVFGEIVTAVHACSDGMPEMRPLRPGLWELVCALAERAIEHWDHPDRGIWEVQDRKRHFVSSKLFCWTALHRAIAMAGRDALPAPTARWSQASDRIRREILEVGFDPVLGSFRRALDDSELDASVLLLPRHGLLPAEDPRIVSTVDAVRERLSAGDGLLRRYIASDGLPGTEGAFTACSFWLVDCLARLGRFDEGHAIFEQVIGRAGRLGLLSEEIEPGSGDLLGNHPQAFSHLTLIRAALALSQARGAPQDDVRGARRCR